METITEFLVNSQGLYDLGSMIKLFGFIIATDGVIMTIYAIIRGFHGR